MKRQTVCAALLVTFAASLGLAQGFEAEPVFDVKFLADRTPAVAGEILRLAVEISVDAGWHVNTDEPGDEFSCPPRSSSSCPMAGWRRS